MGKLFFGELDRNAAVVPVIMAGGSGTRFWPRSRHAHPKQFLSLTEGGPSLIQQTVTRLSGIAKPSAIMVVTAAHQRELVNQHVPEVAVLAEPRPCNTAPCVGYAAKKVLTAVGDVPMVCLPADHIIEPHDAFVATLREAVAIANAGDTLVTIGVKPTHAETGYGYIRCGERVTRDGGAFDSYKVAEFVEKPDTQTAENYLAAGNYFWNSGMFVWKPSSILAAIERFLPELATQLDDIASCFGADNEAEALTEQFSKVDPISIDFGVMEKADNVVMVSGDSFTWNDIGSWSAWADCLSAEADADGNAAQGDVLLVDSTQCTVIGNKRLIAGVGLENIIVVETDDALLVCHKDKTQQVKTIVDELKKANRKSLL